jgi:molybdopterin synthase sulfur carrier subunit
MKIRYFATLRDVTHRTEEDWTPPEATVGDLLRDLVRRYGTGFERLVLENGKLRFSLVLVNGQDVREQQGLQTPLAPDDTVVMIPPVGGG